MFKCTYQYEPYFYIACKVSIPATYASHVLTRVTERHRDHHRGVAE